MKQQEEMEEGEEEKEEKEGIPARTLPLHANAGHTPETDVQRLL